MVNNLGTLAKSGTKVGVFFFKPMVQGADNDDSRYSWKLSALVLISRSGADISLWC